MAELNLNGLTVLVVEDEELLAEIVCSYINDLGASVVVATDGEEAFEVVKSRKVDLIVSDQSMPGMTGLELAKETKESDYYDNEHFILMTGYAQEEIAEIAPELMDHITIVNKPFDSDQFEKAIEKSIESKVKRS